MNTDKHDTVLYSPASMSEYGKETILNCGSSWDWWMAIASRKIILIAFFLL